jgi:hypothetical protein
MQKQSKHDSLSLLPGFIKGQHWELMDKRLIQIGHVGRVLVHHRIIVPWLKRSMARRQTLTSVKDLQKFLAANNAVLVEVGAQ